MIFAHLRIVERSGPAENGLVRYTREGKHYPILAAFAGPLEAIMVAVQACSPEFQLYACIDLDGALIPGDDGDGGKPSFMLCHPLYSPLDLLAPQQPGFWLPVTTEELLDFLIPPRPAPDRTLGTAEDTH